MPKQAISNSHDGAEDLAETTAAPLEPASFDVAWQGRWLQDPRLAKHRPRTLISPERSPENCGELQNIHTLFRREFSLPNHEIKQARLFITADDCYKLYMNGTFVGGGPALSFPWDYYYNGWDVTRLLQHAQLNCLGVYVYYQGLHNLAFISGDNLQGLLLQLEIEFADGTRQTLISDRDWRCHQLTAFEGRQLYGYQTAFSEHIDLRRFPVGWKRAGFAGHDWTEPHCPPERIPSAYHLAPQPTPPLAWRRRAPVAVQRRGDGRYFIDFGTEVVGETNFIISGESGHVVEIRHGEELDADGNVRYQMRCNCDYQEFVTLSGRTAEQIEFFDYKGFRYVEVLNWPEELQENNVWVMQRHYPFPAEPAVFSSSSQVLDNIWELCANGVKVGTLDTYLDCPTREKGGFLGDGYITGISHLLLTGDTRILRKFLKDAANGGRICPGLLSVNPTQVNGELAEYSMLWPVLLEYYLRWSGDIEFVNEMHPVLANLLEYYRGFENADGLLEDVIGRSCHSYAVLVDWPKNLRDGYDDPLLNGQTPATGVVNTMLNGFYYGALQAAVRLKTLLRHSDVAAYEERAAKLRRSMLTQLRNPHTGLFIDSTGSDHSSLHANVTPLLTGVAPPEDHARIIDLIRQKRLSCGVYFSCFVLQALYNSGAEELAYDLITSTDLHSWQSMLKAGATTCMEAWAPDLKWNTSWCHPWSSAPLHMIVHELMGLRPATPGWKTIRFAPRPPVGLASADLAMTVPQGRIRVSFKQDGDGVTYQLHVPEGAAATCVFAASVAHVTIAGKTVSCRPAHDGHGISCTEVAEPIGSGDHIIETRQRNCNERKN